MVHSLLILILFKGLVPYAIEVLEETPDFLALSEAEGKKDGSTQTEKRWLFEYILIIKTFNGKLVITIF